MNLFGPILDRARAALTAAEAAETLAHAELVAHRKAPADPGDAVAIKAWRVREGELIEAHEIAESVLTHWRGVVADQEVRAEKDALAAERKRLDAEAAGAASKRVNAIATKVSELAKLLAEHAEHRKRIDDFNRRRGELPPILDAETRVRRIPGKTIPAEYRDEMQWLDRFGEKACVLRDNGRGEMVPVEAGYTRQAVRVCTSPERFTPTVTPRAYADAITLVDIMGRAL